MKLISVRQCFVLWVACCVFSLAGMSAVFAQEAPGLRTTTITPTTTEIEPVEPVRAPNQNVNVSESSNGPTGDPSGLRLGSFLVSVGAGAGVLYTDNALSSSTNKVSDRIYTASASIDARSDWTRHSVTAGVSVVREYYQKSSTEDSKSASGNVDARIDVLRYTTIDLGAGFNFGQEERSSIDLNTAAISPTKTQTYAARAGINHRINRVSISLRGAFETFEFDDTPLNNGTIEDSSDRSYVSLAGTLRVGYEFSPRLTMFTEATYTDNTYDRRVDSNGEIRDSQSYGASVGIVTEITGLLSGETSIGYRQAEFDDPNFSSIGALALNASLTWTPTPLTTVVAAISTGLGETTITGSSGSVNRTASIDITHDWRENITLNANASVEFTDFNAVDSEETTYSASVGFDYSLGRKTSLVARYRFEKFDATTPGRDYEINTIGVRLTYKD